MAKQVVKLKAAKTVNGDTLDIKVSDGAVMVDGVNVIKPDIGASNGVIHVVDSVILPD